MSLKYNLEVCPWSGCPWSEWPWEFVLGDCRRCALYGGILLTECRESETWVFQPLYTAQADRFPNGWTSDWSKTSVDQVTANHRLWDHLSEPSFVYLLYCIIVCLGQGFLLFLASLKSNVNKIMSLGLFLALWENPVHDSVSDYFKYQIRSTIHHHQYKWTISQYNIFVYVSKSKYILYH